MKLFLDNCLAPRHAVALNTLLTPEHSVVHLREKFEANAPDEDWMAALGEEGGWVVISGDHRISKNKHLRRVWRQSGFTAFFLKPAWMKKKLLEQHSLLAKHIPTILKAAESSHPGTGYSVSIGGRVARFNAD